MTACAIAGMASTEKTVAAPRILNSRMAFLRMWVMRG
jgi:hypothetical protein